MSPMTAEALVIGANQERLADGGGGLDLREVHRTRRQPELADARADSPGADQGDAPAGVGDGADLLGQVAHAVEIKPPSGARQDARADLDDPSAGGEHDVIAYQVAGHRSSLRSARPAMFQRDWNRFDLTRKR